MNNRQVRGFVAQKRHKAFFNRMFFLKCYNENSILVQDGGMHAYPKIVSYHYYDWSFAQLQTKDIKNDSGKVISETKNVLNEVDK